MFWKKKTEKIEECLLNSSNLSNYLKPGINKLVVSRILMLEGCELTNWINNEKEARDNTCEKLGIEKDNGAVIELKIDETFSNVEWEINGIKFNEKENGKPTT